MLTSNYLNTNKLPTKTKQQSNQSITKRKLKYIILKLQKKKNDFAILKSRPTTLKTSNNNAD